MRYFLKFLPTVQQMILSVSILLSACFSSYAQQADRTSLDLTIYNNNLGVVRDVRSMTLPMGQSTVRFTDIPSAIDPTTVQATLKGTVLEQNYQYDLVNAWKIFDRYIGKDITLTSRTNESFKGKLLSASGETMVLQPDTGGIMILRANEYRVALPTLPDGLILQPTLVWSVQSQVATKQPVMVSYQTGGFQWHAEYVATLNDKENALDLNAWVSIDNKSGATYPNATLKLIAGDVNRVQENSPLLYAQPKQMRTMAADASAQQFDEKEFFEYHLYTLQRPVTLANNEIKQIALFEAKNVPAKKQFLYRGNGSRDVQVFVEFINDEKSGLGVPMPKGKVRMNKQSGSSAEFIGEDAIDHTPRNEAIKLKLGNAFDIKGDEVQKNYNKISEKVFEQTMEVTITNRKKEDVVVNLEKMFGANWTITQSSLPYTSPNTQKAVWAIPAKKDGKTVLTYTVRYAY
jgi:hypothetical protein